MSTWLIRLFLVEYVVIMIVCLFERNWVKAFYWLGAAILNYSILLGFK
jgi:hypothetical protein